MGEVVKIIAVSFLLVQFCVACSINYTEKGNIASTNTIETSANLKNVGQGISSEEKFENSTDRIVDGHGKPPVKARSKKITIPLDNNRPIKPINIALLSAGTKINEATNQSFGNQFDLNRLIDNDLKTDLKMGYHQLKKMSYSIFFQKPYQVVGLSFYQPPDRNSNDYLSVLTIKAKYPDGTWSKERDIKLRRDSGDVEERVEFEKKIIELRISPSDNWGGNYVYMGDIKIWAQ